MIKNEVNDGQYVPIQSPRSWTHSSRNTVDSDFPNSAWTQHMTEH